MTAEARRGAPNPRQREVQTMKRTAYMRRALEALTEGRITEEVYDAMIMDADIFCDDDEDDEDDDDDDEERMWRHDRDSEVCHGGSAERLATQRADKTRQAQLR